MKNIQLLLLVFLPFIVFSQSTLILPSGITPASNIPRLTNNAIKQLNSGNVGDLVFDLTFQQLRFFNGSTWEFIVNNPSPFATINSIKSSNNLTAPGISSDSENSIYLTGNFTDSLFLGQETIMPLGIKNSFILKTSPDKHVIWKELIYSSEDLNTIGITIDSLDNIFVYGTFSGLLSFKSFSTNSVGGKDIFIIKLDKNGVLKFGRRFGGVSDNVISSLKVSPNKTIYFCGNFNGSMPYAGSNRVSLGGKDGFIAEMDTLGNQISFNKIGGNNDEEIKDFCFSDNYNLVVGGGFRSTISVGTSTITPNFNSFENMFLATLNYQNNSWQWAIRLNTSGNNNGIKSITQGKNGAIFVAGYYSGSFSYDSGNFSSTNPISYAAAFLLQTSSGLNINWAQNFSGIAAEIGEKVYCNSNGDVTFLLNGVSSVIYSSYLIIPNKGLGDSHLFKFSKDGNFLFHKNFSSTNEESISNTFIDKNNRTYIIGTFTNMLRLDNSIIFSLNKKQNIFWGFYD